MTTVAETRTSTKRIDGDTHFFHTVDYHKLKDMLPRAQYYEARDLLYKTSTLRRPTAAAPSTADAERDPDARLQEMDRLNFDAQVLMTQEAMPSPLLPQQDKPVWLRIQLAKLYNDAAAELQNRYAGRYIPMATVAWDDIPATVAELERVKGLGLKAVQIKGSYWNAQNLDTPELYPFWEAVNALELCCLVHSTPQGCGPTIANHVTGYPMVGTERYHRLHLGVYLGFGLDYAVACAALTLGGILDEFPNLRFVFYEAGASWMTHAMLGCDRSFYIERQCSRTSALPSELIRRHCMTAVESLEPLEQMVEAYGSDIFVLGTDFPHPEFQRLPNATSDITEKARLTDEDKSKILGGNMARALKL